MRGNTIVPRVVALLVLVLGVTATPLGRALAADDSAEEDLIRRGVEDRRHQDDAAALELFRKAYAIRQSARSEAQMGLAEVALGRWADAEQHIEHALTAADPWIRKNSAALQGTLVQARKKLGGLQVMGSPEGAEVVVEGEVRGKLPMNHPVRVRVGECRFDVRAPGFAPLSRTVEITAGALTRETVRLSELSVAVPPPPVAVQPAVAPPRRLVVAPNHEVPEDQSGVDHGSARMRTVGIILGGAGVLAAGAGLTFGLLARSAGEHDRTLSVYNPSAETVGKREQLLQYVGYGVGAALVAGGVTTFILGSGGRRAEAGTSVSLIPSFSPGASGANGALASISGRL